ncbi:MAG: adenylate kinase [Microcoleaceae cyanobacterium]|jgi:adenylate kinase
MQLIFVGPPGAGKGTQALIIAEFFHIPHISTGDILRAAVSEKTPLGEKAQSYMDRGELVPDQLLVEIVEERLKNPDAQDGWILDGFPRTVPQAEFFDQHLAKKGLGNVRVVNLDVPDDILVTRLLARGRKDDTEETIRRRLEVYRDQTSPLINYYRDQLITIDGDRALEDVTESLKKALS